METRKVKKVSPQEAENQELKRMAQRTPQERLDRMCRLKRVIHRLYEGKINQKRRRQKNRNSRPVDLVKKDYNGS